MAFPELKRFAFSRLEGGLERLNGENQRHLKDGAAEGSAGEELVRFKGKKGLILVRRGCFFARGKMHVLKRRHLTEEHFPIYVVYVGYFDRKRRQS